LQNFDTTRKLSAKTFTKLQKYEKFNESL
jgi:hypothetical protein